MQFGDLYKSTAKKEYQSGILALPRQGQDKCVHPIYEIKLQAAANGQDVKRREKRGNL